VDMLPYGALRNLRRPQKRHILRVRGGNPKPSSQVTQNCRKVSSRGSSCSSGRPAAAAHASALKSKTGGRPEAFPDPRKPPVIPWKVVRVRISLRDKNATAVIPRKFAIMSS
jgi:hypothetical protein